MSASVGTGGGLPGGVACYRMEVPNVTPDAPETLLLASGPTLYCPECEYNLTGLTENRCPECGKSFAPGKLARIYSGESQPIGSWGRRDQVGWRRAFFRTCRETYFSPVRFAKDMPWCCGTDDVTIFWILCRLMAGAVVGVCYVVTEFVSVSRLRLPVDDLVVGLLVLMMLGGAVALGTLFLEGCMVLMLEVVAVPLFRVRNTKDLSVSTSWWNLVAMFGGFLPLAVVPVSVGILLSIVTRNGLFQDLGVFGMLGVVCWWLGCLSVAVHARSHPGPRRAVALVLLWVPLVVSVAVGWSFLWYVAGV